MKIFEYICAGLIVLGTILYTAHIPGGAILVAFSGMVLSMFYFLLGWARVNGLTFKKMFSKTGYQDIGAGSIVTGVLYGFFISIGVLAWVFKVLSLPGAIIFGLQGAVLITLISVPIIIIFVRNNRKSLLAPMVARSVVLLGLCLCAYLLPVCAFNPILCDPEYQRIDAAYFANPTDENWEKRRRYVEEHQE